MPSVQLVQGKTLDVVTKLFGKAGTDDQLHVLDRRMNAEIRLNPENAGDVAARSEMGIQWMRMEPRLSVSR